jgi:hypothetical protein
LGAASFTFGWSVFAVAVTSRREMDPQGSAYFSMAAS